MKFKLTAGAWFRTIDKSALLEAVKTETPRNESTSSIDVILTFSRELSFRLPHGRLLELQKCEVLQRHAARELFIAALRLRFDSPLAALQK